MKKEILIALVCAILMLITPFTVVAQEKKVSSNLTDEPDIEGLVAQLRVVIDEILQKYGHIQKIKTLCTLTLNKLNLLRDIFENIVICIFILIKMSFYMTLALFFLALGQLSIADMFFLGAAAVWYVEWDRFCTPFNKKSIIPVSKIKDIDDITIFAEDCPCLQE